MNISFLNFSVGLSIQNIDLAWLSFKSYTEDNYKGSSKLNWSYPIQSSNYSNIDELVDLVLSQDPHILACSLYVWNSKLTDEVVERVKLQKPDVFVVYGGPHILYKSDPDYFKNHWYIDVVCETDGYGEPFINELFYQLETDKDLDKVPYAIWPYGDGYKKSSAIFNKKKFEWPRKIYERNADYLTYLKNTGDDLYLTFETSRGCPYGCVYCEWSGGINSKVVFKPYDYVLEDLDYLYSTINPHAIGIVNANFGIVDKDIDITKHIVTKKIQSGYPNIVNLYGPSKVKKDNVYEILELMRLANISLDYKLPVQDFDEQILDNINRPIGEGWEKELNRYKRLVKDRNKNNEKRVEWILGLPGSTIENYYSSLDVVLKYSLYNRRYEWFLLPTSPASEKAYVEKFKIKTFKTKAISLLSLSGENDIVSSTQDENGSLIHKSKFQDELDIVCETYSYNTEEYIEMFAMNHIIGTFENEGYLRDISKYLNDHLNVPYSKFYKALYDQFLFSGKYLSGNQHSIFMTYMNQLKDKIINKSESVDLLYFTLPENFPWKIYLKSQPLINVAINLDRFEFYQQLNNFIVDKLGYDEGLEDLCQFTANNIKWIDYNPDNPFMFKSKYDWLNWRIDGELIRKNLSYTPKDRTYSTDNYEIEWHKHDINIRINSYFLPLCTGESHPKFFVNLEKSYD